MALSTGVLATPQSKEAACVWSGATARTASRRAVTSLMADLHNGCDAITKRGIRNKNRGVAPAHPPHSPETYAQLPRYLLAEAERMTAAGALMTLSSTERRELASQMEKARELRVVQLNPTMGSAAVGQSVKALADYAVATARGKTVVLMAVVR